jgi:uncharacterized membrane protein
MPTHSNTPSDPALGAAPPQRMDSKTAARSHHVAAASTSASVRSAPRRNSATTFPPGRGATITQLGQALQLIKLTAPLHPILVHFTIVLTVMSFAFDLLAFLFGLHALIAIGWWMLATAILVTIATIATGVRSRLRWPVEEGEARSFLRAHMVLGPTFFGLLVAAGIWRGELWQAGSDVTWWYLAAMVGVTLVMAAQGYLGGELVYRYGAEVKFHYRRLAGHTRPFPEPIVAGSAETPTRSS